MIELPGTTLCCIDCLHHELSVRALKQCMKLCTFDRVLFLSDKEYHLKDIEAVKIPNIRSKEQYSVFVLKELNRHIDTDFVLLVQWDGYIVNHYSWRIEFQQYDYIGAKWRYTDGCNVGNGGFSLRSKRLLRLLSRGDVFIDRNSITNGEDHFICRLYRRYLETQHNIKFAPETIADEFSYEYIESSQKTFGFHGLFNMWRYIQEDELEHFVHLLSPGILFSKEVLFLGLRFHKLKKFSQAGIVYRKILQCYPENSAVSLLLSMSKKETMPAFLNI